MLHHNFCYALYYPETVPTKPLCYDKDKPLKICFSVTWYNLFPGIEVDLNHLLSGKPSCVSLQLSYTLRREAQLCLTPALLHPQKGSPDVSHFSTPTP